MGITDEKISHDQGMTSYRCQVLSFEDKMRSWKPGRLLRLKSFYVNGVKLRLQGYPNGDSNANRDFTSIFVDSMSPNDIVIDMDLSMGRTKLSNTSMKVQAYGGLGWARFYDHNQHNFVAQRYFHPQELITPPAPKYLMLDHWELKDDFGNAHQ